MIGSGKRGLAPGLPFCDAGHARVFANRFADGAVTEVDKQGEALERPWSDGPAPWAR
jgi:hypothetical protein